MSHHQDICDRCQRPGHCCFAIPLMYDFGTPLDAVIYMASFIGRVKSNEDDYDVIELGLPFIPLWRIDGGPDRYWCPHLTQDGRCGIYQFRPHTCRIYKAQSDPLCWHHDFDYSSKEEIPSYAQA